MSQVILITVHGGVAEVVEETVPKGFAAEIIDWDNLEADPQEEFYRLGPEARAYVVREDPEFQKLYEELGNLRGPGL